MIVPDVPQIAADVAVHYDELDSAYRRILSRNVRRTWGICLRRLAARLMTDQVIRRLVLSPTTRNRSFALSLPRIIVAMRTGAMCYGIFGWHKQ